MVFTENILILVFVFTLSAECAVGVWAVRTSYPADELLLTIRVRKDTECIEGIMREALSCAVCCSMHCRILLCCAADTDEETLDICRRFSRENAVFEVITDTSENV